MSELLLDTCAFIWLANGDQLTARARQAIATGQLSVSPITAWEIGGLLRKGRLALLPESISTYSVRSGVWISA